MTDPPPPSPSPLPSSDDNEKKHKESIPKQIENKARAFIKSDSIREPQTNSEFLTKNTMRLIEKTYFFLGGILLLFVIMSLLRESIVETVLPLFTLVIGGILGFMSKDLLRGTPNIH